MRVSLIAAVAENGVIGADGEMPWSYPADLAHFKETTMGHPVVLGRRTYETIAAQIGGPLPGRLNIVLSRRETVELPDGAVHATGVEDALRIANEETAVDTVYVAGGGTVYEAFLDRADELVITEVPESPDGDTRFPEIDDETWIVADREQTDRLTFLTYRRRDD
ncbi:MAG: dihydrofolate reductase [Natronomonas sp.]